MRSASDQRSAPNLSQLRREREREAMRVRILAAARELFAERGVDAVTMRAIAERIEYSATAIYFHFRDKEALLRALLTDDFRLFAAELQKVTTISDPVVRLRASAKAFVEFGLTHPNHYRLMFMTPLSEDPVLAAGPALDRHSPAEDAYTFLQTMVREAADAGAIKAEFKDLELVCQVLLSGFHGIVSLQIAHNPGGQNQHGRIHWRSPSKLRDVMCDCLLAGLVTSSAISRVQKKSRKKGS